MQTNLQLPLFQVQVPLRIHCGIDDGTQNFPVSTASRPNFVAKNGHIEQNDFREISLLLFSQLSLPKRSSRSEKVQLKTTRLQLICDWHMTTLHYSCSTPLHSPLHRKIQSQRDHHSSVWITRRFDTFIR